MYLLWNNFIWYNNKYIFHLIIYKFHLTYFFTKENIIVLISKDRISYVLHDYSTYIKQKWMKKERE